jgi:hypothetical protein
MSGAARTDMQGELPDAEAELASNTIAFIPFPVPTSRQVIAEHAHTSCISMRSFEH